MNTRVGAMDVKYLIYLFLDPFCGTVVSENWSIRFTGGAQW